MEFTMSIPSHSPVPTTPGLDLEVPPQKSLDLKWEQRHVELNPAWHETQKVGRIAFGFLIGAMVAVAAAICTALAFTATPIAAAPVGVVLFGAMAVALPFAHHSFSRREYWSDPVYRREQGEKAAKDIQDNHLSYPEIRVKYGELIDEYELFSAEQLGQLLSADANELDHNSFVLKHGEEALSFLSPEDFDSQAASAIAHEYDEKEKQEEIARQKELKAQENVNEAVRLLTEIGGSIPSSSPVVDPAPALFSASVVEEQNEDSTPSILDATSKQEFLDRLECGLLGARVEYAEKMQELGVAGEDIIEKEIQRAVSFGDFVKRNGKEAVRKSDVLKALYLTQPYEEMIKKRREYASLGVTAKEIDDQVTSDASSLTVSEFYARHGVSPFQRRLIDPSTMKEAYLKELEGRPVSEIIGASKDLLMFLKIGFSDFQKIVQADFATGSVSEFRQKHGVKAIQYLTDEQKNSYRDAFLIAASQEAVSKLDTFSEEMKALSLSRKEVLGRRWEGISIEAIFAREKEAFLSEIQNTLNPGDWQERVSEAIQSCSTLDEFKAKLGSECVKSGLIDRENPYLQKLVARVLQNSTLHSYAEDVSIDLIPSAIVEIADQLTSERDRLEAERKDKIAALEAEKVAFEEEGFPGGDASGFIEAQRQSYSEDNAEQARKLADEEFKKRVKAFAGQLEI